MDQEPPVGDRQFRRMAEAVPVPAWSATLDGGCDFVNQAWRTRTGLSLDQSRGSGWLAAVHPDDYPDCAAAWATCIRTQSPLTFELRLRGSDGTYAWCRINAALLLDTNDRPERWFGTADDRTPRSREETNSLWHERQRLSLALDAGALGIFEWNVKTDDVYWSPECFSLLGGVIPRTAGTRDDFARLLHPEDAPLVWARVEEALAGGRPFAIDFRIIKPDGSLRWLNNRGTVVRDEHGHPQRIVGVVGDITERKQAEEALRDSELRFRRLHDSIRDAFVVVDMNGRICESNAAYREMLGYSEEELKQLTYVDLTPARWHAAEARVVSDQILATGSSGLYEKEYRRRDGTVFPVELCTYLIRDTGGEPHQMWAIVRDVTERRHAEEALDAARKRLEAALHASQVVLFHQALDLRYTWVHNPVLGLHEPDIVGRRDEEITERPDDAARLVALKQSVLDTGIAQREEVCIVRNEQAHFYDLMVQPDYDAHGQLGGVLCAAVDITFRRQAEEALRASEHRYRTLLDATNAVTHTCPPSGLLEGPQPSWTAFTGQTTGEAAGDGWLRTIHPDDVTSVALRWSRAIERGVPLQSEHRVRRHDGLWRWMQLTAAPVRDTSGRIAEWFCASVDITDRKLVEEELREADRRKDQFVAILAHELRNPLAPIRTSIALFKTRQLSDPMLVRSRDIIDRQVAQMARLLDDLLDVSRLSRGTLTLQRSRVLLRDVLASAIETAIPIIEPRGQDIVLEGLEDTIGLYGDAARLIQVFGNLLTNASKYSPRHSTITLHVVLDGESVSVEVRDSGVGIAAEHLESVFGLFAQVDGNDQTHTGGLGIGLALVKRLVELHGGTIIAASPGRGHGSTFTVRLPAMRLPALAEVVPQAGEIAAPPVRHRVLVADDNEDAADTIALLFRELGCEVRTVYSGDAAIHEAEGFRPDVVFLDLGMPDLDGREVCRQVRLQPWGANMMLVALTGWGRDEDRQHTSMAGFDQHIVKPADPDVLVRLLRELPQANPR